MSANPFSPPRATGATTGYRSLRLLTALVVAALAADGTLMLSNAAAFRALAVHDPGVLGGAEPRDALGGALTVLAFLGAALYFLVYFTGGILFLWWLARANRNARALGAEDMEFTPGWMVGWFFVPMFNLFKPYEAVDELFLASDPASAPDEWGAGEAPRYILLWWVTWIGFGVSSFAFGSFDASLITTAIGSVSAALAAIVVLAIHRRLAEKERRVGLARLAGGELPTPAGPRHRFF